MTIYKKQKGISVLLIIMIASIVFTIALGVNSISFQQAKTMGEIGYSLISFYAADSGAEQQLYALYKSGSFNPDQDLLNGASYNVKATAAGASCSADNFCINSVGTYKEIQRALKLEY